MNEIKRIIKLTLKMTGLLNIVLKFINVMKIELKDTRRNVYDKLSKTHTDKSLI